MTIARAAHVDDTLISESSLRSRIDEQNVQAGSMWKRLPELADLPPGATTVVDAGTPSLLVCRLGSELLAYVDLCVRCDGTLCGAVLSDRLGAPVGEVVLRCPGCHALYDICRGGTSLDDEGSHLTPVPLLTERGVPSVLVTLSVSV